MPNTLQVWYSYKVIRSYNLLIGTHIWEVHSQLCEILTDTPVASILNEVPEEHWIEFYQLYLHDFLRSVHLVTYENQDMAKKEYEVTVYKTY